jgi:hypothetical protein
MTPCLQRAAIASAIFALFVLTSISSRDDGRDLNWMRAGTD